MSDPRTVDEANDYQEFNYGNGPATTPRISVCIPTYQRAGCLANALQSVFRDATDDFEIVVVDNASSDDTLAVIEAIDDSRIRCIRYRSTVTMFANHNRCVEHARAPWIIFLHSDDAFPDGYLTEMTYLIEQSPDAAAIVNSYHGHGDGPGDLRLGSNVFVDFASHILIHSGFPPSGTVYRRDAFETGGRFLEPPLQADSEMLIRWSRMGMSIHGCHFRPTVWRVSEQSITHDVGASADYLRANKILFDAAMTQISNSSSPVADHLRSIVADLPGPVAVHLIRRAITSDYRTLGTDLLRRRTAWRLCGHQEFWRHVVPLLLCPTIYWRITPWLTSVRRHIFERRLTRFPPQRS